jgi:hypothetical protein
VFTPRGVIGVPLVDMERPNTIQALLLPADVFIANDDDVSAGVVNAFQRKLDGKGYANLYRVGEKWDRT